MKKQMSEQELKEKTRAGCMKALAKLEQKEKDNFKNNLILKLMCLNAEHLHLVDGLIDSCLLAEGAARSHDGSGVSETSR